MACSTPGFLSFPISQSLLKLMSIECMRPSNHLILCRPLLLLPSIFPSIRVFSSKLALHSRWSKYWSFSFSISPSNEYSGLTSFRISWRLKDLFRRKKKKKDIIRVPRNWRGRLSLPTSWSAAGNVSPSTGIPKTRMGGPWPSLAERDQAGEAFTGLFI